MKNRSFLQKISYLFEKVTKVSIIALVLTEIIMLIFKPLIVFIIKLIFNSDWVYKIFKLIKEVFSNLPKKIYHFIFDHIPEPHTNKWGSQIDSLMSHFGHTLLGLFLIIGIISVIGYIITIIFRHHYGEMAPFKNDMEARKLKKEIIKATDTRLRDKSKNRGNKKANTLNVFKWYFNREVRHERNIRKSDRIAKRTIRRCKVYIETKLEEGQPEPIKHYQVIFRNPANDEASSKVYSKIKNLHNKLIQFTKVTFDQIKTEKDRSVYKFEGSVEKELKEAKSVVKQREKLQENKSEDSNQESTDNEGNFPLSLLVDRSAKIDKQKKKAEQKAKDTLRDIEQFLASEDIQADLDTFNVGNTSIGYVYKTRYTKMETSTQRLQEGLSKYLGNRGVIIDEEAGKLFINVSLDANSRIDIDNKKTIRETMRNATDPTHAIFGIGLDNKVVSQNIGDAPHIIVSGSTGSGKSVGVNYMITSMTYKANPEELEIALLDPKQVEFLVYEGFPFNKVDPVTNPQDSCTFLKYMTYEMNDRFKKIAKLKSKDIDSYNKKAKKRGLPILKKCVVFIDEFADLMMTEKDVEHYVTRLTQMGRAGGIYIVLSTQRPSVDVITGLIKNNMSTRLAYQLSSVTDSKVALGSEGAEKLNGAGDSLLKWKGQEPFTRMQGGFLEEEEIESIVEYMKENIEPNVHVDYKARVAREEGEEDEGASMHEAITSLNNTRIEQDNNSAQDEEKQTKSDSSDEVKTVSVDPAQYIDTDSEEKAVANQSKGQQSQTISEETEKEKSPNKRKSKDEMSDIDNAILQRALKKSEERRKMRRQQKSEQTP